MRTIAQATAPQITLRNCSKEVEGKVSICAISVKRKYMPPNTYIYIFCRRFLLVTRNTCHHERF